VALWNGSGQDTWPYMCDFILFTHISEEVRVWEDLLEVTSQTETALR